MLKGNPAPGSGLRSPTSPTLQVIASLFATFLPEQTWLLVAPKVAKRGPPCQRWKTYMVFVKESAPRSGVWTATVRHDVQYYSEGSLHKRGCVGPVIEFIEI